MRRTLLLLLFIQMGLTTVISQVNTDRVLAIGRNALYFEDYVLSIQYFNQVIKAKPWIAEPYFYRGVAKLNLDDFRGADEDCTKALELNPYLSQAYYARGIARQSMEQYALAIADYKRGLELKPEDQPMTTNSAIAYIQSKEFDRAKEILDELIRMAPKSSNGYLMRGSLHAEQGDTALALADYNQAIEIDPYFAPCYGSRAILLYQTNQLKEALADLNEAIRLNTRESGYYINRGLVRYQMNDLRGAMSDYDHVIDMDSRNLLARFNRGLLRFQVGDHNRAIKDFDVVLEIEPDNYMAYYNRGLLRSEVGDYKGAIKDFDIVLKRYPNFIPIYYNLSDAKRKTHDLVGADKDYWAAIKMEQKLDRGEKVTDDSRQRDEASLTREESDKNIEKFSNLVVYDKGEEQKSKFQSEIRGRVQDKNILIDIEHSFILSYYEKINSFQDINFYDKTVEALNARMILPWKIIITNQEAPLNEEQINAHFRSIDRYSSKIAQDDGNADDYFGRAMDFMQIQDFNEAIENLNRVVELDPSNILAYFNRAAIRYKQNEYQRSIQPKTKEEGSENTLFSFSLNTPNSPPNRVNPQTSASDRLTDSNKSYEYEMILSDYNKVIQLNPDFIYAYFNRGNIRCNQHDFRAAIVDYNEVILRDPEFAEAYFNRGLAFLSLGEITRGITDLSKAGELGKLNAYSIIKRMTSR